MSGSIVMLEILVTFEEFQLVFNFMLFFTLTLLFSIQEKYKVTKVWGGGAAAPPPSPPVSTGLLVDTNSPQLYEAQVV